MDNKSKAVNGEEHCKAAGIVLRRAVELDTRNRFTEALVCYQEGLHMLMEAIRASGLEERVRSHMRQKAEEYMNRAEHIHKHVDNEKKLGRYHEQYNIDENSKGHSYETVMGRFLDEAVTEVEVQDPYIRSIHQLYNFLRLSELIVKKCPQLHSIKLQTGVDKDPGSQEAALKSLQASLQVHGVQLTWSFPDGLHDREITLNNGWVIKIGRGLDYFKPPVSKFSLGYCDLDLRPCLSTTVDIFHRSGIVTRTQ